MIKFTLVFSAIAMAVLGGLSSIQLKQLKGFRKLLTNLDHGVFATCKIALFSEMVDFNTADARCKKFELGGNVEGHLATVNDEEKNLNLKVLLSMAYPESQGPWADDEWVWAGLRKVKHNDGTQDSMEYRPEDWEWADGSTPETFQKWYSTRQPDQKVEEKDGVRYLQNQMRINHEGAWDDTFAYKTHPYACDYQGKYILSATRKSWSEAKEACQDAGLIMAKVRNSGEVEEMKEAAEYFLGAFDPTLRKFDPSNWIWLGGNDAKVEGVWEWNDGKKFGAWFEEMPWGKKQPDNADFLVGAGTQNYLAMSKKGEFDDSFDWPELKRPFACQCPDT